MTDKIEASTGITQEIKFASVSVWCLRLVVFMYGRSKGHNVDYLMVQGNMGMEATAQRL